MRKMIRFSAEKKVILFLAFGLFSLTCVSANNTLISKEDDLSDIRVEENFDEGTADKTKRQLPKVQSVVIDILKPVPVVDTIKEEEKYGNTGDKFNKIGRAVVNGVEKMSNLVNSALNFPMEAVKKLSRSATEALNNLGGKLVGLQR